MPLKLWLSYALLEILLSLSPGPAVFTVISQGVRFGGKASLWGNLGILSGNGIYFLLSALGLGAFIAASPNLYHGLQYAGSAFLMFTALKLLLAKSAGLGAVREVAGRPGPLFRQALFTQLSNPKTIIFFVSFLAPFINPHGPWPVAAQIALLAATTMVLEFPILLMYGYAGAHGSKLLPAGAIGVWQDRIAGTCLAIAAIWLALR